jgi:hypothetical protein
MIKIIVKKIEIFYRMFKKIAREIAQTKYLLSPRWERIEVRGKRIWIFTPTLTLPPQGGGKKWS